MGRAAAVAVEAARLRAVGDMGRGGDPPMEAEVGADRSATRVRMAVGLTAHLAPTKKMRTGRKSCEGPCQGDQLGPRKLSR